MTSTPRELFPMPHSGEIWYFERSLGAPQADFSQLTKGTKPPMKLCRFHPAVAQVVHVKRPSGRTCLWG